MISIFERLKDLFYKISHHLYYLYKSKGDMIVLNAWIDTKYGVVKSRNFGDELSYYLLYELTGKTIANYSNLCHRFDYSDLLFIGSLIECFTTPKTIIWGSGAIRGDIPLKNKPLKVCAVRGKLSRQYLLEQGVECPEIYGDPALLLPLVYKPNVKKKYKIGLIAHHNDERNPLILHVLALDKNIKLISFTNYIDWHSVVDLINECDYIVSSSLHGLIIADAYRIPNLWVKVSDNIIGGTFKFHDYFSGVGRQIVEPMNLSNDTNLTDLLEKLNEYTQIRYDIYPLINACPVCLKSIYRY